MRDDGSVDSPESALDEVRQELEDDAEAEDREVDEAELDAEAQEALHEQHPAEDFVPRTYVSLDEPRNLNYGDLLLRFPASLARPTIEGDVDWSIRRLIPAPAIEVRINGEWQLLA